MTIADIAIMTPFLKLAKNEKYENSDIVQAIVNSYPYTNKWSSKMAELFEETLKRYQY